MPIVIALALASWISLVYYAMFHPTWKHHATPPKTEVAGGAFEALHGGRQLMPIWGEPVDAIPGQRSATAAETYQAANAQTAEKADAAPAGAGATATATATRQRHGISATAGVRTSRERLAAALAERASYLLRLDIRQRISTFGRTQRPLRPDCAVWCG